MFKYVFKATKRMGFLRTVGLICSSIFSKMSVRKFERTHETQWFYEYYGRPTGRLLYSHTIAIYFKVPQNAIVLLW